MEKKRGNGGTGEGGKRLENPTVKVSDAVETRRGKKR